MNVGSIHNKKKAARFMLEVGVSVVTNRCLSHYYVDVRFFNETFRGIKCIEAVVIRNHSDCCHFLYHIPMLIWPSDKISVIHSAKSSIETRTSHVFLYSK